FMYPVGGGLGPPQGLVPLQQQQPQQQQGFPMVPVMQPSMQGMMGMNFGGQMPPGAMPMQSGMAIGMQTPGMAFLGQPQFMGMRPAGPQYTADMQKQMAEEHQKRLEQQQKMLEEDRKRRQFEEQKQKLRLLSSVKPKTGEKSRDDALEAIKGNLDGFSRDAKLHPSQASQTKKQGSQSLSTSVSIPTVTQHSAVNTSSKTAFQGPSLEEKLFSSCDFTAEKVAQVNFKSKQSLDKLGPKTKVSVQFQSSGKSRNWASASEDLSSVFIIPNAPASAPITPSAATDSSPQASSDSGVGVYPQTEHIQPLLPGWLFNDSLVPEIFKKVLEFTMTPSGIDTAKLYPILMSSGLPREALGQIWASANRTTPGMLTKEELYTVLALIGVAQSGLPAMNVEILSQFPSPPVPSLPALAMAMATVMPQHQTPMMNNPPISMAIPTAAPAVMQMATVAPTQAPTNPGFITSFPAAPVTKADDDDFQEFQEAPKSGVGEQTFTEFQGESAGSFPTTIAPPHQNSVPTMLTPVSGSSTSTSSDKYAVFKQLSATQPAEPPAPASDFHCLCSDPDIGDKYSVFRQLEQPADKKPTKPSTFPSVSVPPSLALLQGGAKPSGGAADDFGDFALFGSSSDATRSAAEGGSAGPPQDDFADFMAFGSSGGEPKSESSVGVTKADDDDFQEFQEAPKSGVGEQTFTEFQGESAGSFPTTIAPPHQNSVPTMLTPVSGSSTSTSSDKYAVFKQLSATQPAEPPAPASDFHCLCSDPDIGDKYSVFRQLEQPADKKPVEGGSAYDDTKECGGGSFSSLKSDADDFADFQSSKFCTALGASEKTLVDKVAAFKQAKEDSASVKSLDLPSIGGSSAGKDDSEDALSVQLDMKLSDVGGDLKHVMSDSSLDLPSLSAHQPPATEADDMKFEPFGTSGLSTLVNYDWSERDECAAGELGRPPGSDAASLPSSAPAQREASSGSAENVTSGGSPRTAAPLPEDGGPPADDRFEAFADFGSKDGMDAEDDFGDFASTFSEKSDSPAAPADAASDGTQSEASDEFGAFQGDKPKFGKSDFLKASAQANVKSSEEMIKNELATFDLSVQGSHKRSHSLGDKEIRRSPPSPAPEQAFRDRSNTLSEKPALPVIRDKYKDLTGEVEESERYAYEWQRCLENALEVITKANNILNGISSSSVCTEVIQSAQGMEYLLGVVEVYRVTKRVELGIKATAVCSEKLQQLLKDINRVWNNLMGFMSLAKLTPDESSLDFSSCILRHGIKNAKELACGVCLLNVEARSKVRARGRRSTRRPTTSSCCTEDTSTTPAVPTSGLTVWSPNPRASFCPTFCERRLQLLGWERGR
ncbi:unnamed protein product, partial [Tetraodon nigroviridis]